jgi:hypothetical protein
MRLVPEIREQLLDAAFGAAEPRPGRGRRPRSGALAIASSIVVTVVVAAVFLLSLHGSQAPPSGAAVGPKSGPPAPASGATPVAWVNALGKAGSSTRQHDRACRLPLKVRVRSQRFLTSAPPRSITSILPSLATPARGAVRVTIRELRALHIEATGIYARYAWQGRADGVHYYVVPAAVVGTSTTLPARCYREEIAAFRTEAGHFPANQRVAAITYARQRFSPEAATGVAVLTVGRRTSGGSFYQAWRLAQLNTEPAIGAGGGGGNNSTTTTLLVTNQVASVTATYPAQTYPGRVPRTFSVTKRPARNLIIFHLSGAWDPPQLTFRSRRGAVIAHTPNR